MSARRSTRPRRSTAKPIDYSLGNNDIEQDETQEAPRIRPRKPSLGDDDGDLKGDTDQRHSDRDASESAPEYGYGEDRDGDGDGDDDGDGDVNPPKKLKRMHKKPRPQTSQPQTPSVSNLASVGDADERASTNERAEPATAENGLRGPWRPLRKKKTQAAYRASLKVLTKRRGPPETDGEVWRYLADTLNKSLRIYVGPLQRHDRFNLLLQILFGPDRASATLGDDLRRHFSNHVLPDRGLHRQCAVLPSPWLPPSFEADQVAKFHTWYRRVSGGPEPAQQLGAIPPKRRKRLLPQSPKGDLITFIGPHDSQKPVVVPQGGGVTLSERCEVIQDNTTHIDGRQATGWLFDVGGVPLAIGWAPRADSDASQILALAVAPHSDYAYYRTEKAMPKDDRTLGCVQFWKFESEMDVESVPRPSRKPPQRVAAIAFDWGRPTRMQWCPVAPETKPGALSGVIAVLCEGRVHIFEVKEPEGDGEEMQIDWVQQPIASISLEGEELGIMATCFTWVDVNRIAVGFTDGTIGIWSLSPFFLIVRQVVHHAQPLDICSGYPSNPYVIASVPMGGCPTVTDFTDPTMETAAHTTPSAVFQPNMLDWSDHMQGFLSTYANSTPGSSTAAFLALRYPSQLRTIFQGFSQPVCLAAGKKHCFTLIGCADGSLWSFNTMRKVFFLRHEKLYKIRIFQHEFRRAKEEEAQTPEGGVEGQDSIMLDAPPERQKGREPQIRGAVRFLHGFKPEINDNPRNDHSRAVMKKAREKAKAKETTKGKRKMATTKTRRPTAASGNAGLVERTEKDDYPEEHNPLKSIILHEPETRVVAVAWNPNLDVGWWAAAAMGSGLVRVMDLGLD